MKSGLEQSRQANLERENDMERARRDLASKIEQKDTEIQHLRDTTEVGKETSVMYHEYVEANTHRMQAQIALQQDEILALRNSLDQYVNLEQAPNSKNEAPPPSPPQEENPPPAPVEKHEEADIIGIEPELVAPSTLEINLFANKI